VFAKTHELQTLPQNSPESPVVIGVPECLHRKKSANTQNSMAKLVQTLEVSIFIGFFECLQQSLHFGQNTHQKPA
jgi:hypothetical protein